MERIEAKKRKAEMKVKYLNYGGYDLQSDMFGPWQSEFVLEDTGTPKTCEHCIYLSESCICLGSYENLVFGTKESPNAGKEVSLSDTCRTWYELNT